MSRVHTALWFQPARPQTKVLHLSGAGEWVNKKQTKKSSEFPTISVIVQQTVCFDENHSDRMLSSHLLWKESKRVKCLFNIVKAGHRYFSIINATNDTSKYMCRIYQVNQFLFALQLFSAHSLFWLSNLHLWTQFPKLPPAAAAWCFQHKFPAYMPCDAQQDRVQSGYQSWGQA